MKYARLVFVLVPLDQLLLVVIRHWHPTWINTTSQRWFPGLSTPWSLLIATVLLLLIVWAAQLSKKAPLAVALITAGLLSNGLAVLFYGRVLDYLPLPTTYTNAADLLIVAGCGVAIVRIVQSVTWPSQPA